MRLNAVDTSVRQSRKTGVEGMGRDKTSERQGGQCAYITSKNIRDVALNKLPC